MVVHEKKSSNAKEKTLSDSNVLKKILIKRSYSFFLSSFPGAGGCKNKWFIILCVRRLLKKRESEKAVGGMEEGMCLWFGGRNANTMNVEK